jgi:glycosyltransferase 2 family protein
MWWLFTGWRGWILRLAVSAGLLAWLVAQLRGGGSELKALRIEDLWPAAAAFALSTVLGAWQWTRILRHAGVAVSARKMQALYWVGLFFNNFLPSNVGGDLVKVADLAVDTGKVLRPLAGTVLDRVLGLTALVTLAFAAGLVLGGAAPAGIPWWALTLLVVPTLGLAAAILSGRIGRLIAAMARRLLPPGLAARVAALLEELSVYRAEPWFVLQLGGLALVVQSLRVATHVGVAWAMGLDLSVETVLGLYVVVPILGVAIVLPLSFNGLGVREFAATRLMPDMGIASASAFSLQVATYFVQVAVSLIGGVVFVALLLRGRFLARGGGS